MNSDTDSDEAVLNEPGGLGYSDDDDTFCDSDDEQQQQQQHVEEEIEDGSDDDVADDANEGDDDSQDGNPHGRRAGGKYPVSRYKDIKLTKDDVSASIGNVTRDHWEEAQEEVEEVYLMFEEKFGTRTPTQLQIIDLLLGEQSKVYLCFKEHHGWDYATFKRFNATFALQCSVNLSTSLFYSTCGRSTTGLCTEKEYRKLWRQLSEEDEGSTEYFWKLLESAINSTYRKLFVRNRTKKSFVIDDFKLLFQAIKMQPICGIKIMQHVRANRRGATMHQIVESASGVCLGIRWEMADDTTKTATTQLIAEQLARMEGGSVENMKNLSHLSVHGDRAYTNPGIAEDVFLKAGMIVTGTKASTRDNPFVVDKAGSINDARTEISSLGPKSLFIKEATIRDNQGDTHECCIQAYRNGTGNVIFVFTTKFDKFEWEFVPVKQTDLSWYEDMLKLHNLQLRDNLTDDARVLVENKQSIMREMLFSKAFKTCWGAPNDINILRRSLLSRELSIISLRQRSADWFFMRRFSFTSRTTFSIMMLLGKATKSELCDCIRDMEEDSNNEYSELIIHLDTLRQCLKISQNSSNNNNDEAEDSDSDNNTNKAATNGM